MKYSDALKIIAEKSGNDSGWEDYYSVLKEETKLELSAPRCNEKLLYAILGLQIADIIIKLTI